MVLRSACAAPWVGARTHNASSLRVGSSTLRWIMPRLSTDGLSLPSAKSPRLRLPLCSKSPTPSPRSPVRSQCFASTRLLLHILRLTIARLTFQHCIHRPARLQLRLLCPLTLVAVTTPAPCRVVPLPLLPASNHTAVTTPAPCRVVLPRQSHLLPPPTVFFKQR